MEGSESAIVVIEKSEIFLTFLTSSLRMEDSSSAGIEYSYRSAVEAQDQKITGKRMRMINGFFIE